jgi:quercetin dioxygenase-like cupin family protein
MKIFKTADYINMRNPDPGKPYRPEILTDRDKAEDLGGMFGLLVPGSQVPYHYHKSRESVIIAISGEAVEIVEGEEITFKAGDIIFLNAREKHMTVNRSDQDFRYLEFFTCPPVTADFVEVR